MAITATVAEAGAPHTGRHEAPRRELLAGVTRRSAFLVLGVLLLQLGFVLSYVGAFHAPTSPFQSSLSIKYRARMTANGPTDDSDPGAAAGPPW